MKKNILGIIISASVLVFSSCEDSLDKVPKTEITAKNYFKTASDLETYTNGLYQALISAPIDDVGSDNVSISTNANTMYTMVNSDGISSSNIGGWDTNDWANLRRINYMLNNIHPDQMEISGEDLRHYVGIAKFFRGNYYYNKVKNYSSVPFYNTAMDPTSEDLYKASDSRVVVVDSVMRDLEFAARYIRPVIGQRTRVSQYAALAQLARVSLHEATFRKYHSSLGLMASANTYFEKAITVCEEIIVSEKFRIHGTNAHDYSTLFCSSKLRDNNEIIMFMECDQTLGKGNNSHTVLGEYWGLSRSLMETYQMKDGTDFNPANPDGSLKTYVELFKDRDPRFAETFAYPGFKISPEIESSAPYRPKITYGGFIQLKYYPKETAQRFGWNMNYTSLPLFRYAEILLIYAEAKAELGTLTQADLDKSVNLIRDRAGMPKIVMSSNILENIRRERRVELACEGFRLDDIKRWAKGELLGQKPQGVYIHKFGAFDVTGDGIPDIAILPDPGDESSIADLPENVRVSLVKEYLRNANGKETSIYLDGVDGKSGYIEFYTSKSRKWTDKFYFTPIPKRQMQLNPNLIQSPGWENN
ncbi:MAG: RagB/SusD family nutrient uptake outer membrane protein [Prevotella sp.]|jgi:hypothetical protein|nr:RagB/SusD family nutrient uptake outer membrane protein [Prevotella sp.]